MQRSHAIATVPKRAACPTLVVCACICLALVTVVCAGGCGRATTKRSWERLETSEHSLELYVAESRTRNVKIPVSDTTDSSLVHFELVNRGAAPVTFETDLATTCGCVQASADRSELAPGETCKITASLSHSPTPGQRTISLDLTVTSPQHTVVTLLVNVTYTGDWIVSAKSLQLKGVLGSYSEQSLEVNGSKAALDAMTWTVTGDVTLQAKRTSDTQRVLTVRSLIDSLLTEKIAGSIHLKTAAGAPTSVDVPITQTAEPLGTWLPKAIVLAEDHAEAKCEIRLVDGAVIQHIEAPGFVVTPLADQPASFQVSVSDSNASTGVRWMTATVAKGTFDQQIRLPVLVKLSHGPEKATQ